ncbi:MAG: ComF family protein [Clostridia bacterium]|nr:ComF family protein [Clostridia bacterium]
MSGLLRTAKELFCPPRCLGCGERFAPSVGPARSPYLCRKCQSDWEWSTLAQCPQCFAAYRDCTCAPHVLKRAGCMSLVKLTPYSKEDDLQVAQRIVLRFKRTPNHRSLEFCAEELCEGVRAAIAEADKKEAISHTVIAHLPRSRRNLRRFGFDQAKLLAGHLSRLLGIKHICALKRVHSGKEQKKLTLRARMANIKGAFAPGKSVKGMRVILVDDIVTTGAGMAEAVRVLRRSGAAQIICVAAAATQREPRPGIAIKFP